MNVIKAPDAPVAAGDGEQRLLADSADSTVIRKIALHEYRGALREMRRGHFAVTLPRVRDSELRDLGTEIGGLAALLQRKFDEIARLNHISLDIGAGVFLDDILNRVYESFRGVIPFDRIGCALLDRETMELHARWARTEAPTACIARGYSQHLAGSSLERVLATGEPRILSNLPRYLANHPGSDSTRLIVEEGMRSSLACPLLAQGEPVGFLFFSSQQVDTYDARHTETFQQIAGQLAVVVEKSLLYEHLHQLNEELRDTQRKLEHEATHDALTGLPNRRAILEALDQECARAARSGGSCGVLVLDVDHFKRINDRYGHAGGDAVLCRIGEVLASSLRAGERIGRLGGEEFVAVLVTQDKASLQRGAERIRQAVEAATTPWLGSSVAVTVSIGAALMSPGDGATGCELLARADRALYRAKAAGRNMVEVADSSPVTGQ